MDATELEKRKARAVNETLAIAPIFLSSLSIMKRSVTQTRHF